MPAFTARGLNRSFEQGIGMFMKALLENRLSEERQQAQRIQQAQFAKQFGLEQQKFQEATKRNLILDRIAEAREKRLIGSDERDSAADEQKLLASQFALRRAKARAPIEDILDAQRVAKGKIDPLKQATDIEKARMDVRLGGIENEGAARLRVLLKEIDAKEKRNELSPEFLSIVGPIIKSLGGENFDMASLKDPNKLNTVISLLQAKLNSDATKSATARKGNRVQQLVGETAKGSISASEFASIETKRNLGQAEARRTQLNKIIREGVPNADGSDSAVMKQARKELEAVEAKIVVPNSLGPLGRNLGLNQANRFLKLARLKNFTAEETKQGVDTLLIKNGIDPGDYVVGETGLRNIFDVPGLR